MLAVIVTKTPVDEPPTGTFYQIDSNEPVMIGRGSDVDIRVRHSSLSREHAIFVPDGDQWLIKDLHSANGILLNGVEVKGTQILKTGMILTVGLLECKVACNYLTDLAGYQLMGTPKPGMLAIQRAEEILVTISIHRLLDHIRNLDLFNDDVAYAALFRGVCEQNAGMKNATAEQWPDVYEILYPDTYDDEEEWEYEDEDDLPVDADAEAKTPVTGASAPKTETRRRRIKPRSERRSKPKDGSSRKPKQRLGGKIQVQKEVSSKSHGFQIDLSTKSVFIGGAVLMVLLVIYSFASFAWERSNIPVTVNKPIVREASEAITQFGLILRQMRASGFPRGQKQCTEALRVLKASLKEKLLTPQETKQVVDFEKMIKDWPTNR
jgi:hypothetical protein